MNYSPHTLQKLTPATFTEVDGNPVVATPEAWVSIAPCRCDDFDTKYLRGISGSAYTFTFRVIMDREETLKEGDRVRAMNGEVVRGEGFIRKKKPTNYLNYQELWLSE